MTRYKRDFDMKGSGDYVNETAGENLGNHKLVYRGVDGYWYLADADAAATMPVLGITMGAITATRRGEILLDGYIGDNAWTWTGGSEVYASTTAGELTATAPAGAGDIVQVVAIAVDANIIQFTGNAAGKQGKPWDKVTESSYIIFKEDTTYYAKNGVTGQIDYSGTNAATVIQSVANVLTNGGLISLKEEPFSGFDIGTKVTLPTSVIIQGEGRLPTYIRGSVTNDYIFEVQDPYTQFKNLYFNGRGKTGHAIHVNDAAYIKIEDCHFYNFQTAIDVVNNLGDTNKGWILDNFFSGNDYAIRLRSPTGKFANEFLIQGNHILNTTNTAIEVNSGAGTNSDTWILNNSIGTMDIGIDIASTNAVYTKIFFNHIEAPTTAGINFTASPQYVHIMHNRIQNTGFVGAPGLHSIVRTNDGTADLTPKEFFIYVKDPDSNIGTHPAVVLPDGADTTVYDQLYLPLEPLGSNRLDSVYAVIVAAASGNMRRSATSNWGAVGSEAYNASNDSIGAGQVAVTQNILEEIDITALFSNLSDNDLVGFTFTREGSNVNDTVNADCYYLGVRVRYL